MAVFKVLKSAKKKQTKAIKTIQIYVSSCFNVEVKFKFQ